MQRVLITGITGMAGSHLADHLLDGQRHLSVFGTKRSGSDTRNINHRTDVTILDCDLNQHDQCVELIRTSRPDFVFHLAAKTFVPASWQDPTSCIIGNLTMQLNLLEAIRASDLKPKILVALSPEEYGRVPPEDMPIREDTPLRPISPYGVSKVSQDMLAYQYHHSYGMHIVRARPFNHEGPRRGEGFVTSNFAKQIAEIEAGLKPPVLRVGNLSFQRDWSDVRDIARAYWLALECCAAGEDYIIASGKARTVQQMLDTLLSLSNAKIEVVSESSRMRPVDVPVLMGDPTKFCKATNWAPAFTFEQTMADLLNYWRARVANESASLQAQP